MSRYLALNCELGVTGSHPSQEDKVAPGKQQGKDKAMWQLVRGPFLHAAQALRRTSLQNQTGDLNISLSFLEILPSGRCFSSVNSPDHKRLQLGNIIQRLAGEGPWVGKREEFLGSVLVLPL